MLKKKIKNIILGTILGCAICASPLTIASDSGSGGGGGGSGSGGGGSGSGGGGSGSGGGGSGSGGSGSGGKATDVPEVNAASAGVATAAIVGGILLYNERKRKSLELS